MGSGIKGVGSGIRRVGSRITALGSGITDHGIGIISCFYRDQGLGCGTSVGLETKIDQAFEIKEEKFANKNGISDEKTYLVTTLPFEKTRFVTSGKKECHVILMITFTKTI